MKRSTGSQIGDEPLHCMQQPEKKLRAEQDDIASASPGGEKIAGDFVSNCFSSLDEEEDSGIKSGNWCKEMGTKFLTCFVLRGFPPHTPMSSRSPMTYVRYSLRECACVCAPQRAAVPHRMRRSLVPYMLPIGRFLALTA